MVKTCPTCHQEFKVKPSHFEKRKYCSQSCMAQAYAERMRGSANPNFKGLGTKICLYCGDNYPSHSTARKFCSLSCAGKYSWEHSRDRSLKSPRPHPDPHPRQPARTKVSPKTRRTIRVYKPSKPRDDGLDKWVTKVWRLLSFRYYITSTCARCSITFSWKYPRTYCNSCLHARRPVPVSVVCLTCRESFQDATNRRKYCSRECYAVALSIRQRGEKSHLWKGGRVDAVRLIRNSAEYDSWRETVFRRDDYTCQMCVEKGGKLAAHHIKMFSKHHELIFNVANGITLCWSCHTSIRQREAQFERLFVYIVWSTTLRPGEKPTEVQLAQHERLRDMAGAKVIVATCWEDVERELLA